MSADNRLIAKLVMAPRAIYWCVAAVILFAVFWGANQPQAIGILQPPFDKLAHFAVYCALGISLALATRGRTVPALMALIAVVVAIGAADELYQTMVPGRHSELGDFLVDTAAACIVVPLMHRLVSRNA